MEVLPPIKPLTLFRCQWKFATPPTTIARATAPEWSDWLLCAGLVAQSGW
jgi:hypothetical protein